MATAITQPMGVELARLSACRSCGAPLEPPFLDLGMVPLVNAYRPVDDPTGSDRVYPLRVHFCAGCSLVQLQEVVRPADLFEDYAYFSSFSDSWLRHAERYCQQMMQRLGLHAAHRVVEVASNDGYLLQYFRQAGVPVLGIEPAANVAEEARRRGIETVTRFFGAAVAGELAAARGPVDLIVANNVLGHVPDLHDFVEGVRILLAPGGIATFEFPHVLTLLEGRQFDTIYHEHVSYLSLLAVERVVQSHGLCVVDVEELPTHGGSLRVFVARDDPEARIGAGRATAPEATPAVAALRDAERAARLSDRATYHAFAEATRVAKLDLVAYLVDARQRGLRIAGYGAPAKGTVLLNTCGIDRDVVEFTVDRSPHKQGCFVPGTSIPIFAPEKLREARPDLVVILPWNLADEIMDQMASVHEWGGRFVIPVPGVAVR